ncbi:MAG: ankyrin repeat domain-containing protein [Cycloclasticus sp.]
MEQKNIALQIAEAIKTEDEAKILILFKDNPGQVEVFTPFGGQTWLGYASQIGKIVSLKTLVDVGISVNRGDKRDNRLPICSAAANDHIDIVVFLLKSQTVLDVSLSVRNALFSAIVGRSPRIVKLLLDAGIDSEICYNSESMTNMDAVAFALMRGELESARIIATWNSKGDENIANSALEKADVIAEQNS